MATDRIRVQIVGGRHDGEYLTVDVDQDGRPPAVLTMRALGEIDWTQNPGSGPMADVASQQYYLDVIPDPELGGREVYRPVPDGQGLADAA